MAYTAAACIMGVRDAPNRAVDRNEAVARRDPRRQLEGDPAITNMP